MSLKLTSAKIQNFKSLGDVTLNFRDLTILVGANSSGKSNCLEALNFLSERAEEGTPPSDSDTIKKILKIDAHTGINIAITIQDDNEKKADYKITLNTTNSDKKNPEFYFAEEDLLVNDVKVIEVKKSIYLT